MTLEEELVKMWTLENGELFRGVRAEDVGYQIERVAHSDYHTYTGLLAGRAGWKWYDEQCKQTGIVIKEHLLEAASSPNVYLREWVRLLNAK